jgi:hypothetical protein
LSFKQFDQSTDITSQISPVNEIIPLTGTFFSGANAFAKTFINITSGSAVSGGFWETIYDASPTSVSSSALVDLTYGHSSASLLAAYSETYLNDEKQRMYEQMAQKLLGNKNSLFSFDSVDQHDVLFVNFRRRIRKDEVKKGEVSINVEVSGVANAADNITLTDAGAASSFTVGHAGDESSLFSGSTEVGKVYYNAGIVAFATGVFLSPTATSPVYWSGSTADEMNLNQVTVTGTIDNIVDGFRNRINDITFHNQTNLHSTIYFCRALNPDFNYSSNSTFVDSDGRIVPTSGTDNQTRTYPTTVGMYDVNNVLMAVAKVSEPIKKSPDNEVIFRIRLNF